jgi:uncharacterized membrane protein (UPF0127 family)
MSITRKRAFSSSGSKFRGNHPPRKGRTWLYLVLLVAVVAIMVSLGKWAKGPSGENLPDEGGFNNPLPNSGFTREGELELFNKQDSLIVKLDIEIADDNAQTTRGLMYRRSMGEKQGMLFIFPREEIRSFWMKNTYIPLDLIFLDSERRIVHIHESAQPKSEQSIPSVEPAKYVLEVNEGFSARYFLEVGDSMSFVRTY